MSCDHGLAVTFAVCGSRLNRRKGFQRDVTKTGNGERGTGNGERESGNECTAVTRLRIQNGGGNEVYKP